MSETPPTGPGGSGRLVTSARPGLDSPLVSAAGVTPFADRGSPTAQLGPGWLRQRWVSLFVVAAAYAAGSYAAFFLFRASSAGAVLFPPAGLTLAVLTVVERRRWPEVLATVAVTEILVDLSQGQRFPAVGLFALANTAEPLVGAWLGKLRPCGRGGRAAGGGINRNDGRGVGSG